ncbi:GNAT family N-acetyltransferase [Frankia sp. AgKG'84/4]|uniref:GNAT family N-acetyltransferase n=1 Tax=Frankia sp. AgKG'84/4 TaxID=573490 RepID=UPI0035B4276A
MAEYVSAAIADRDGGFAVPFAIRDLADDDGGGGGRVVGSTRFLDLGFWRPESNAHAPGAGATGWSATQQTGGNDQSWTTTTTTAHSGVMANVTVWTSTYHFGMAGGATQSGGSRTPAREPREGGPAPGAAAGACAPEVPSAPPAEGRIPPVPMDPPSVAEIGATWLAASAQRTHINTRAKVLLFSHAFEDWQAVRVCLKTDVRNTRSRAAIERLGARFEGVRRAHMLATDGAARDTAYFSVLREEWPGVRAGLVARLARR